MPRRPRRGFKQRLEWWTERVVHDSTGILLCINCVEGIMVMMSDGDFDDNIEDNVDVHGLVLIRCLRHAALQTLSQSFQAAE